MTEFYAYIDESGDEGTGGKGTKWFVITALIASQDEATALGSTYHRLKQRIDLSADKVLHWAELSHPRKKAVIEELAKQVRKYTRFEIPVEKARELYSLIDGLKELQINGVKNLDLDKIVVRRRKLDVCFYRL